MARHPLIELAQSAEVKQAKGFRQVAETLNGESLEAHYQQERANAPDRTAAGKKYFGSHPRPPSARRTGRDAEHLAMALVRHAKDGNDFELPEGGKLSLLDYQVPLVSAAPDKAQGDADPNKGVPKVDGLGLMPDDRIAVVVFRYVAPSATRGGTGDTPLRALLEGLACCAMVEANKDAIAAEIAEATGRTVSSEPPALLVVGGARYWEICRKREAQKGAAWIREMERLQREIGDVIGVETIYLGLRVTDDPGWSYEEGGPALVGPVRFLPSWELRAGKLKPKPKPKPRKADEEVIVEADLSRPVRSYGIRESYAPGDRIDHPTLGEGVVQALAGVGKITVLFGEKKSVLVHERP